MVYFVFVLLLAAIARSFADTATDFAQTPTSTMQAKLVSGWKGCPISGTGCGKFTYYTAATAATAATEYWLQNPPTQQVNMYIGDQWITTNGAEITMTQALVEPLAISFPCSLSVSSSSSTEPYLYTVVLADIDGAVQPTSTIHLSESYQLWTATNYYCNANGGFCESNVKIGTACLSSACTPTTWIASAAACADNTAGSKVCMGFTAKTSMKTYTMTVDKPLSSSSIANLETAFSTISATTYLYGSGTRTFTIDSLVANTTATPPFTTVNFQVSSTVTTVATDLPAAKVLTFDVNTTPITVKSGTISGDQVTWVFNEVVDVCTKDTHTTSCGAEMKAAIATLGGTFSTVAPTAGYLSPPTTANSYTIVADYGNTGTNAANGVVLTSAEVAAAVGKQITPTKLFPNVVTAATETGTSTISTESHRLMLLVYKQKSNTAITDPVTSPVGTKTTATIYKYKGYTPDSWSKLQTTEIESSTPVAGIWFYATQTF